MISLILLSVLLVSLAGCGASDKTSGTDSASAVSTDQKTEDKKPDKKEEAEPTAFNPDLEHRFLATDIRNHSIVVFDLNACDGNYELLKNDSVAVVWEWDADEDPNCTIKPDAGIDAAKLRYSGYYKKDVIIACSSNGWCGVIDYEAKSLLWEYKVSGGGPHSVEMLPNGDLIIGVSGDKNKGSVRYVPLSAGAVVPTFTLFSPSCHGVQWDPEKEILWVLDYDEVYGCEVKKMGTKNAHLVRIEDSGSTFDQMDESGHAFSPIYGQPGKYWASAHKYLWQFDTDTGRLTRSYNRYSDLTKTDIKGIASFADGTVVESCARLGGKTTYDWSSGGFRIITYQWSTGKVKKLVPTTTEVIFTEREFYKVQPFTKDYQ